MTAKKKNSLFHQQPAVMHPGKRLQRLLEKIKQHDGPSLTAQHLNEIEEAMDYVERLLGQEISIIRLFSIHPPAYIKKYLATHPVASCLVRNALRDIRRQCL